MVAVVSLVIIAIVTVIFSFGWLSSRSDDRVAVIANFLSLGTFLLALAAGVIALVAYSAATGLPVLRLKVWTPLSPPNDIRLYPADTPGEWNIASIAVRNTSKFAARTPAVLVQFVNCGIPQDNFLASPGWTPIAFTSGGAPGIILAIQWDGGPNYAIHGDSERHLPGLNLQRLTGLGNEPYPADTSIRFRLLADGYSYAPKTDVPVSFTTKITPPLYPTDPDSGWL
jgi:hypothetical protein